MVNKAVKVAFFVGLGVVQPAFGQPGLGTIDVSRSTGMFNIPRRVTEATRAGAQLADAGRSTTLAAAIRSTVIALPAAAPQPDIEAQIVFTIDQATPPLDVALAALGAVDRSGFSDAASAAVDAVIANRSRLAATGTGAIAGGGDVSVAFSTSYSVAGGSSDYSS